MIQVTPRKYLTFLSLVFLFLAVAFFALAVYGPVTQVAFKIEDGVVYRKIANGLVGANCFDKKGNKVIAPSRWFGLEWTQVASVNDPKYQSMSIICNDYSGGTQSASVQGNVS